MCNLTVVRGVAKDLRERLDAFSNFLRTDEGLAALETYRPWSNSCDLGSGHDQFDSALWTAITKDHGFDFADINDERYRVASEHCTYAAERYADKVELLREDATVPLR